MTGRELVESSLRLIGAIATGETMTSESLADGIDSANDMIDLWSIDGLMVYQVTREEFALTASQASRTMGSGGNFNTTRPTKIIRAGVEDGDSEIPVEIITADQWAKISNKSASSTYPFKIYPEGTYPLETINLWPVPSGTNNLILYSLKPLTAIAANTSLSLPPGYQKALRYNLALELAPEYGKNPSQLVVEHAMESKAALMRQNTKPVYAESDAIGLLNSKPFDWRTGE